MRINKIIKEEIENHLIRTEVKQKSRKLNELSFLLEKKISVGDNITKKLNTINTKFSKSILDFLNSDKIKDTAAVDFVDYDKSNDKLMTLGYTDRMGNKKEKKMKPVKLLSYLGSDIKDIKSYEIEELINHLKQGDGGNFDIVTGPDILKAYHCQNYDEGETMGSCMRFDSSQTYFDIYTNNPNQASTLVLRNPENGKVRGRAMLWKMDNGETFMDRVYVTNSQFNVDFNSYAENNGIERGDPSADVTLENGGEFNEYPYMDTFKHYSPETGVLSATDGSVLLRSTVGGSSVGDWSEIYQEIIPEEESFWAEDINDFVYEHDLVESHNESEFYYKDNKNIIRLTDGDESNIGKFALKNEVVNTYDGYIALEEDTTIIDKGPFEGESAANDKYISDYHGFDIVSSEAAEIGQGEYEGEYALKSELVKDVMHYNIPKDEAVKITFGDTKGGFAHKDDAVKMTKGDHAGEIMYRDDALVMYDEDESYFA